MQILDTEMTLEQEEKLSDSPQPQPQPQLYKEGRILIDTLVADPAITLIEVDRALGFLLSEASYNSSTGDLVLRNVLWARQLSIKGFFNRLRRGKSTLRSHAFEKMSLYRHESGRFVAQDVNSGKFLPRPSYRPYVVHFIDKTQYEKLRDQIKRQEVESLYNNLHMAIEPLPGFSMHGGKLMAPSDYARAGDEYLDMMKI